MKAAFSFIHPLFFPCADGYIVPMLQQLSIHKQLLLERPLGRPQNNSEVNEETKLNDSDGKKKIICRECGFEISSPIFGIRINDKHEHSFFNPHGYVFQIRCFSAASGCISAGDPSSEFTWFPGYTWQIAACSRCLIHLGWKFQSDSSSFYGLIKNNIREQEK